MGTRGNPQDEGFTLIEVLMALIILGTGIAALLGAMAMHAKTTLANRNQAQAESILAATSEYVKALSWAPVRNAATHTCPAIPGQPSLAAAGPVVHDPAFTVSYSAGHALGSIDSCLLQVIDVNVTGNGYTLTVSIVKRPVRQV